MSDLTAGGVPVYRDSAAAAPKALGTATPGTSTNAAREDHVHPPPAGLNSSVGSVVVGQTAAVAIALGIREITVALTGTVVGAKYAAFCTSYTLNGGSSVNGRPSGYAIVDCVCNTAGQITISINAPLLAIGASYALTCQIVAIGA